MRKRREDRGKHDQRETRDADAEGPASESDPNAAGSRHAALRQFLESDLAHESSATRGSSAM